MFDILNNAWDVVKSPFTSEEKSTPAPVYEAVGITPTEAVLAGGGKVEEVGSVKPEMKSRWAGVLEGMGKQLTADSGARAPNAPAFRPSFRQPQMPQSIADAEMAQIAQQNNYLG